MVASRLELLGTVVPDVGRLVNRMWCFFAPDVSQAPGGVKLEDGLAVLTVPEAEVLSMAVDGRMEHALNLAVLFLAVSRHRLGQP